jgi:protein-disulfide isomerase
LELEDLHSSQDAGTQKEQTLTVMKEYKLKINGNNYDVAIKEIEGNSASIEVNGTPFNVEFEKPITKTTTPKYRLSTQPPLPKNLLELR